MNEGMLERRKGRNRREDERKKREGMKQKEEWGDKDGIRKVRNE